MRQTEVPARLTAGWPEGEASPGPYISYAEADIDADGIYRPILLLVGEDGIHVLRYEGTEETPGRVVDTAFYGYAQIDRPRLLNQVVGGLLLVDLLTPQQQAERQAEREAAGAREARGEAEATADEDKPKLQPETRESAWLCRFSGARMRDMRRFVALVQQRIDGEEAHEPELGEDEEETHCPSCGRRYPEQGRRFCPHCTKKTSVFWRLLTLFAPYRSRIALLFVAIGLSSVFNALIPYLSGKVLYDAILSQNAEWAARLESFGIALGLPVLLGWLALLIFVTRLLQQLTGVMHGRITGYVVPGVVATLKARVFSALQRLSIAFFTSKQTGSLMQRVNGDTEDISRFFIDILPYLLFNFLTMIATAIIMLRLNLKLGILSIVVLPPLVVISFILVPRIWRGFGRRAQARRRTYSVLNDSLTGARVVRAFGQAERDDARFDRASQRLRGSQIFLMKHFTVFDALYTTAEQFPLLLVWVVGARMILAQDNFSYGELMTFTGYLAMLQGPLRFIALAFQFWSQSMNAGQRVFEIIDARPTVIEAESPVELEMEGEIAIEDMTFSYEINRPVLSDISFTVKPGEMLGIVGRSGAGKSTLVNLITRLYDVDSGRIKIDGHDIRELSFDALRGQVAMVSQESYLFMGTVAENIAYGRPNAPVEELVESAVAADAHRFICRLPDGYDTLIGTGGRRLSGGERQRLSIARAILSDPRILVLDEATASVDTETEQAIQQSLAALTRGRTTLSIAHRLSTLRGADHIIVLDNGKLTEHGTHDELMALDGTYARLARIQTEALAMRGSEEELEMTRDAAMQTKGDIEGSTAFDEQLGVSRGSGRMRLTPENSRFEASEGGFVDLHLGEALYRRVAVHRCFPFSSPDRFLSIREAEDMGEAGREIGLIERIEDFPEAQRQLLEEQLALRYFQPLIQRIRRIREEYGYSYWETETDRGTAEFTVRNGSGAVYAIGERRYLVNDIDGNRYEIPDSARFSSSEQKLLDLYI